MCELDPVKRGNEESRGHRQYKSEVVHNVNNGNHGLEFLDRNVSVSRITDSRPWKKASFFFFKLRHGLGAPASAGVKHDHLESFSIVTI